MQQGKPRPERLPIVNIILILLFFGLMCYLTVKYAPGITKLVKNPKQFRELLVSYGPVSILIFILFQIMQVVIAAIPGEFIQIAGGYVYGTFWGTVYSLIGILIGSQLVFYLSRLLGLKLVQRILPQQSFAKFNFLINHPKGELVLFLLFLIPGIPKDTLSYLAGLTPIKPLQFFLIFSTARFPGILAASYIGTHVQRGSYLEVIIVSSVACLLFLIGILKKDQIIHKLGGLFKERH